MATAIQPLPPRDYMATGGILCPVCHSQDIEGGAVEIDAGTAYQAVTCHECEAEWSDVYRLVGYDNLKPQAKEEAQA